MFVVCADHSHPVEQCVCVCNKKQQNTLAQMNVFLCYPACKTKCIRNK